MYEPHLVNHANDHAHDENRSHDGGNLLDELDKIAPIKSFDAFPKVRLGSVQTSHDINALVLLDLQDAQDKATCGGADTDARCKRHIRASRAAEAC